MGERVQRLLSDDNPLEVARGAVHQPGLRRAILLVQAHFVAHQLAQGPTPFLANPLGHVLGSDFPRLGDHDVDVLLAGDAVVQDELRHLGRLAAARVARDNSDLRRISTLEIENQRFANPMI